MQTELTGPDLKQGISIDDLADGGMLGGHADGEAVLLVRRGGDIHAIGGTCTHYGGPLAEGLLVGDTVRCPWHHACFDLRTGEALRAPALNPVPVFDVERRSDRVFVTGKRAASSGQRAGAFGVTSVGIVGAGAAGAAACEMLRRRGFTGAAPASAPRRRCRSIGRTCRRTISRATPPRSGFPCARRSFTRSRTSR